MSAGTANGDLAGSAGAATGGRRSAQRLVDGFECLALHELVQLVEAGEDAGLDFGVEMGARRGYRSRHLQDLRSRLRTGKGSWCGQVLSCRPAERMEIR